MASLAFFHSWQLLNCFVLVRLRSSILLCFCCFRRALPQAEKAVSRGRNAIFRGFKVGFFLVVLVFVFRFRRMGIPKFQNVWTFGLPDGKGHHPPVSERIHCPAGVDRRPDNEYVHSRLTGSEFRNFFAISLWTS